MHCAFADGISRKWLCWCHKIFSLLLLCSMVSYSRVVAQSEAQTVLMDVGITDTLLTNVGDLPTGLATTPDGRLLIALKYGQLKVFDLASRKIIKDNALNLGNTLCTDSERGLESVAVDPDFAHNRYIYAYVTDNGGTGRSDCAGSRTASNRVMRFRLNDDQSTSEGRLILGNIVSLCGNHNGGDLHFGADGKLYISVGDGGCRLDDWTQTGRANDNARQMSLLAGKILRLNPDGSIPSDNPFVNASGAARCGESAPRKDSSRVCQEIYATGLRNPFKMAFQSGSNTFYINDVGQDSAEEINVGAGGADYGWNEHEGGGNMRAGLTAPLYSYGHQDGLCAITGGAFVDWPAPFDVSGSAYLFGDYCGTSVYRLIRGNNGYTRETVVQGDSTYGGVVAMHFDARTKVLYDALGNGQIRQITHTGTPIATPVPTRQPISSPTAVPQATATAIAATPTEQATHTPIAATAMPSPTAKPTRTSSPTPRATGTATVIPNHPTPEPTSTSITPSDAPQLRLLSPSADGEQRYWVNTTVYLSAQAQDSVDGDLSSAIQWDFLLRHIPLKHPENEHVHPLSRRFGQWVTMAMPAPEDTDAAALSYVEVRLSVTNSRGKNSTLTHALVPYRVPLTLLTQPSGLRININGQPYVAPDIVTAWAGQRLSISVDPLQTAVDPALLRNIEVNSAMSTLTATATLSDAVTPTLSQTLDGPTGPTGPIDPDVPDWLAQHPDRFTLTQSKVYLPMLMGDVGTLTAMPQAQIGEPYRFVRWANGASPTHTLWVLPFDTYTVLRAEFARVDGNPTATPPAPSSTPLPQPTATPLPLPTIPSAQFGVPSSRLARLSRAANVTRWFNNPISDSEAHYRNYLGEADLAMLRQLKIGALRLVVDPTLFFNPAKPTSFSAKMHYLDDAVDWLIANQIGVVIELHDKQHMNNWENDPWYVEQVLTFWRALAARYANRDPEFLFFEIVNEPRFLNNPAKWQAIQARWVDLMREVVPQHTLIGSGNEWSLPSGLLNIAPVPNERNMIYAFHLYEPFEFTHQGATWMGDRLSGMHDLPFPADATNCIAAANAIENPLSRQSAQQYCRGGWNTAKLETRIRAMAEWGRQYQQPVWMGEFGVYCEYADADSRSRWLRDVRGLAEKYGIGWAIWGYDDCFGLDRQWRNGHLVVDEGARVALGP